MLVYINRVRKMASTLQSMDVTIDDKEMAMAVLNGLPPRFETIITALDAIGDDDAFFYVRQGSESSSPGGEAVNHAYKV